MFGLLQRSQPGPRDPATLCTVHFFPSYFGCVLLYKVACRLTCSNLHVIESPLSFHHKHRTGFGGDPNVTLISCGFGCSRYRSYRYKVM